MAQDVAHHSQPTIVFTTKNTCIEKRNFNQNHLSLSLSNLSRQANCNQNKKIKICTYFIIQLSSKIERYRISSAIKYFNK